MNKIVKYILLAVLPTLFFSCRHFSFTSFLKGDPLATVGDAGLYWEDVESIFTPGMTEEDSLALLNTHIDIWVKQQLKLREAERVFPKKDARIARMVEDYQNFLILTEYEKSYIDTNLDTVITRQDIEAFYETNRNEFRIPSPLVKGFMVAFPVGFWQEPQVRELARSNSAERWQDMVDIALKNDLKIVEFSDWTDLREAVVSVPRLSENEAASALGVTNPIEVTVGNTRYFFIISSYLPAGSVMPLSLASATIRTAMLNRRRQEVLKKMEDDLYRAGMENKEITINIE